MSSECLSRFSRNPELDASPRLPATKEMTAPTSSGLTTRIEYSLRPVGPVEGRKMIKPTEIAPTLYTLTQRRQDVYSARKGA